MVIMICPDGALFFIAFFIPLNSELFDLLEKISQAQSPLGALGPQKLHFDILLSDTFSFRIGGRCGTKKISSGRVKGG